MKALYDFCAKYFAMIHLGYVPDEPTIGMCPNVFEVFAEDALYLALDVMRPMFISLYGNAKYPIEKSLPAYTENREKYRGEAGVKRRKLAALLAVRFKEVADEA